MTFRSRKPAGVDIINEVRAEGGIIDIQPEQQVYETTVRLREGESFEYSLLGLPMPLAHESERLRADLSLPAIPGRRAARHRGAMARNRRPHRRRPAGRRRRIACCSMTSAWR